MYNMAMSASAADVAGMSYMWCIKWLWLSIKNTDAVEDSRLRHETFTRLDRYPDRRTP